jgi:hypothetical protein
MTYQQSGSSTPATAPRWHVWAHRSSLVARQQDMQLFTCCTSNAATQRTVGQHQLSQTGCQVEVKNEACDEGKPLMYAELCTL